MSVGLAGGRLPSRKRRRRDRRLGWGRGADRALGLIRTNHQTIAEHAASLLQSPSRPRNAGGPAVTIAIEPLHPLFGAEIKGVDIAAGLDAATFAVIRGAFEEHSVLLFRGQKVDDAIQIAFSERFGPLEKTVAANPARGTAFARHSNIDMATGALIPKDDRRMKYQAGNYLWHSDSSFKQVPSLCSILSTREVPP